MSFTGILELIRAGNLFLEECPESRVELIDVRAGSQADDDFARLKAVLEYRLKLRS